MTALLFSLTSAYLLGSISPSYLLGKLLKGIDLREHGSGNVGATNAFRVLGKGAGIVTLLFDIGKGFFTIRPLAAFLEASLIIPIDPLPYRILMGLAVIVGHNWTLFLKFKGGKGVAATCGVFLAIAPSALCAALIVWLLVAFVTRNIGLSSLAGALFAPIAMIILHQPPLVVTFGTLVAISIFYTHRSNMRKFFFGRKS